MDLQAFYETIGGGYEEAISHLLKDDRVRRYLRMYPSDEEFVHLQEAYAAKDWESFFRAAHSMKGLCGSLGLKKLAEAASVLTENVRSLSPDENTGAYYEAVIAEYNRVIAAIAELA